MHMLKLVLSLFFATTRSWSYLQSIGYYASLNQAQNLTSSIGKTIYLNCSLHYTSPTSSTGDHFDDVIGDDFEYSKYAPIQETQPPPLSLPSQQQQHHSLVSFNPTWLKADYVYNQNGIVESHRTENIIVTRKGVVADALKHKIKVIGDGGGGGGERVQALKITDLDVRDEGKYICRELSANIDRAFYLSVFSPIRDLSLKFYSPSKYFREIFTNNRESYDRVSGGGGSGGGDEEENHLSASGGGTASRQLVYSSNTVSIKEGDELLITCAVNSSKPAAVLSLWVLRRQRRHRRSSSTGTTISDTKNRDGSNDDFAESDGGGGGAARRLEIIDSYVIKNGDLTLKTVSTSKFVVSRHDNYRLVTCMAENPSLNEKWETKRILNVLYGPKCSKYQRTVYNTGINQTIELECHMTEANPPYLDFSWSLIQQQSSSSDDSSSSSSSSSSSGNNVKERTRTTGFVSRMSYTPRSHKDFGDVACRASNGLDPVGGSGECKMRVELGGAPEPPYECYHKENNRTIIIECKPGFDQGDPEVYFYLLKRKSNGVLVEYARKRDSCSFLISNLILEEYSNDFFIYSSNKYGSNRDRAAKITIENRDMLAKSGTGGSGDYWDDGPNGTRSSARRLTYLVCTAFAFAFVFLIVCCLLMRCKRGGAAGGTSAVAAAGATYTSGHHRGKRYSVDHNDSSSSTSMMQQHAATYIMPPSTHSQFQYSTAKYYNANGGSSIKRNGAVVVDCDEKMMMDKEDYFADSTSSNGQYEKEDYTGVYDNNSYKRSYSKLNEQNIRSPSLINNIQDLDSSPRSKRKTLEKTKEQFGSRSLIDETTETDSENYAEFNRTKIKEDQIFEPVNNDENEKVDFYSSLKSQSSNNKKHYRHHNHNQQQQQQQYTNSYSLPKVNIWYGKSPPQSQSQSQQQKQQQQRFVDSSPESPENDNYSGISVDTKPIMPKKWTSTSVAAKEQHQQFKPVVSVAPPQATATSTAKHHSPPSINEYIDEDQVEEISSGDSSTTNTGVGGSTNSSGDSTTSTNNNNGKLTNIFKWQKTKQIISNETISMDVDDDKVEGILV